MRLNEHDERSYRMTYLNKAFLLTSIPKVKINWNRLSEERRGNGTGKRRRRVRENGQAFQILVETKPYNPRENLNC